MPAESDFSPQPKAPLAPPADLHDRNVLGLLNDRVFGTDGIGLALLAPFAAVGSLGAGLAHLAALALRPARPPIA